MAGQVARDEALPAAARHALLTEFDSWLGLDLLTAVLPSAIQESDPRVDDLVAERQAAREARDWARADEIRDALAAEGIAIEDTPDGPVWRRNE